MIDLLKSCFAFWSLFFAVLAFGYYIILFAIAIGILFLIKTKIDEYKHGNKPLAKRRTKVSSRS